VDNCRTTPSLFSCLISKGAPPRPAERHFFVSFYTATPGFFFLWTTSSSTLFSCPTNSLLFADFLLPARYQVHDLLWWPCPHVPDHGTASLVFPPHLLQDLAGTSYFCFGSDHGKLLFFPSCQGKLRSFPFFDKGPDLFSPEENTRTLSSFLFSKPSPFSLSEACGHFFFSQSLFAVFAFLFPIFA